ncbi:hypothetical protein U8C32_26865 (plasmid) [Sinorhizobium medicae]|uniref:hypothetical protein n=1 Tax=Sinorhizobium medicae TaxID=110321 RepID=UPI002AF6BA0F|nr:hypothetical protein [Sinorhizobium medicae]WQP22585.1 hypothetical protein U8C33_37605 [Sinorhizobium meliloti]WQO48341.1 hypothetical protein U8C42_27115 [Sinorhizobium medicae]WQO68757.1 hypothetical protein U8C40_28375 [Sinorhizobium medicae]WQO75794.1 hypothetical protein U8C31_27910 [Sinorhizobium medicae]WQO94957.1 hypothetical protein U8C32_26865 [Sinorhizobium medicae]
MNEEKWPIVSIFCPDERKLGAALIAVQSALWVTIDKLLENEKGNQQLFDELAVDALNEAKGIVTTGVSIENEAETLAFGIDVLEAILDAKRIQLGLAAKT